MGIRVYKKLYAEFVETAMYLNLLYYAAFTLYNFKNDSIKQTAIAYLRVTIICRYIFFLRIWFRACFARTNICDLYAEMVKDRHI